MERLIRAAQRRRAVALFGQRRGAHRAGGRHTRYRLSEGAGRRDREARSAGAAAGPARSAHDTRVVGWQPLRPVRRALVAPQTKKSALSPRPALVGQQRVAWTAVSGREDARERRAPCAAPQSGGWLHRRRTSPGPSDTGAPSHASPLVVLLTLMSPAAAGQWVGCPVWPREAGQRNGRGTWLPPSNTVAV